MTEEGLVFVLDGSRGFPVGPGLEIESLAEVGEHVALEGQMREFFGGRIKSGTSLIPLDPIPWDWLADT